MIPLDLPNKKGECREGSWVLYRGREGCHRNGRELWSFTAAGGVELFIKPPNLNDISDISEDFDHLLEDMGYQGKHLPKIPKTVGFWQVEVADVRGEFPSDAKEMTGMGSHHLEERSSKVVGKNPHLFWSWSGSYTVILLMDEILHHLGWLKPYK